MTYEGSFNVEASIDQFHRDYLDIQLNVGTTKALPNLEIIHRLLKQSRSVRSALENRTVTDPSTFGLSEVLRAASRALFEEIESYAHSLAVFENRSDFAKERIERDELLDSMTTLYLAIGALWDLIDHEQFFSHMDLDPGLLSELQIEFSRAVLTFEHALYEHDIWEGVLARMKSEIPIDATDSVVVDEYQARPFLPDDQEERLW